MWLITGASGRGIVNMIIELSCSVRGMEFLYKLNDHYSRTRIRSLSRDQRIRDFLSGKTY
jgi:hypothetical protein